MDTVVLVVMAEESAVTEVTAEVSVDTVVLAVTVEDSEATAVSVVEDTTVKRQNLIKRPIRRIPRFISIIFTADHNNCYTFPL